MSEELTKQLANAKELTKDRRYDEAVAILRSVVDSKDGTSPTPIFR